MNIFDVLQYMIDNGVKGIDVSNKEDIMTIHQFLDNGKVLQTTTTQTVFTQKEKSKAKT